jgi:hypothetical protein
LKDRRKARLFPRPEEGAERPASFPSPEILQNGPHRQGSTSSRKNSAALTAVLRTPFRHEGKEAYERRFCGASRRSLSESFLVGEFSTGEVGNSEVVHFDGLSDSCTGPKRGCRKCPAPLRTNRRPRGNNRESRWRYFALTETILSECLPSRWNGPGLSSAHLGQGSAHIGIPLCFGPRLNKRANHSNPP